jgi:threonine dehydrogenase-like Zn-dependent dehydrogenase
VVIENRVIPVLIRTAVDMCEKAGRIVLVGIYPCKTERDFTALERS